MTASDIDIESATATAQHAAAAWTVLAQAKEAMRLAGRSQWQGTYPAPANVEADIKAGVARVLLHGGRVVGYCALVTTGGDPAYAHIAGGRWLTPEDTPYAVVHRMAIMPDMGGRHLASRWMRLLIDEAQRLGCRSMRIDTNHDNVQMLRLLPQCGFSRCGRVMQSDGERIAFERVL